MAKKKPPPTAGSYSHPSADRTNVPTEQVEALMSPDQREPIPFTPAGRVTSRDDQPVLAWQRHKRPTSTQYLAYPLYVKEKVHPGAFARWLQSGNAAQAAQQSMFDDFNGYPEDADKFEWYQHSGNWSNRLIHGESTQVMASLAKREGLAGQVQMIYYDPPYGIDFSSNFQVATNNKNTKETQQSLPNDPRTIRAFRDTYRRGIHSYLDQVIEQLTLARALLHDSGSMFVQIGKENIGRLMGLCDEVFGTENRVALIAYATTSGSTSATLPEIASYLIYCAKDKDQLKYRPLFEQFDPDLKRATASVVGMDLPDGRTETLSSDERTGPRENLPHGAELFEARDITSQGHASRPTGTDWGRSDPYTYRVQALEREQRGPGQHGDPRSPIPS